MSRPTASGLALLHACAYSFRADVTCPPEPPKQAATRGTIFGLLAEQKVNGGPAVVVREPEGWGALGPDERARLDAMWGHAAKWLGENMRPGWCAERAFAWEPSTDVGRELPRLEHRDYSGATATEVCGTADLVWLEEGRVVVADWKTTAADAHTVDARDQIEALALFACRAWGYDHATILTLVVTEGGLEVVRGGDLDMFALDEVAERLAADVARIPTAEPVIGDHCRERYCKALPVCPRTTEALAPALVPVAALTKRWAYTPVIESPDHLQALLQMQSLVKAAEKQVSAAIAAYVADGDVTASDGSLIYQSYRTMPRLNQEELAATVKRLGGSQGDIDACVHPAREGAGVKVSKPKGAKAQAARQRAGSIGDGGHDDER